MMMDRAQKKSGVESGTSLVKAATGLVVGLILLLLAAPAMAASENEEPERGPTIVLLLPLSGELGPMGGQLFEAAELGGQEVGAAVEVIDSEQSLQAVFAALDELKEREDVAAVIGALQRRVARAAAQQAQTLGIPMVVFSPLDGVERAGDKIFRALPSLSEQSERVASYLLEEQGLMSAAVLAPRSPFGQEALASLVDRFNAGGGKVTAFAFYEEGTTDFRPSLEVLVGRRLFLGQGRSLGRSTVDRFGTVRLGEEGSGDFEALIIADSHDVVARVLPFLPRVGLQSGAGGKGRPVQLVGLSSWRGDGLARAGDHGVGAIFFETYGGAPMGGQAQDFEERFEARLGRRPTTAEAEIYDLVGMIGSGVRAREPGESWAQAALSRLREPRSYPGVAGSWSFDEQGAPKRYLRALRVVEQGRWAPAEGGL